MSSTDIHLCFLDGETGMTPLEPSSATSSNRNH